MPNPWTVTGPCPKDCPQLVGPVNGQQAACNGIKAYTWTVWTGNDWEAFPGWPCPTAKGEK